MDWPNERYVRVYTRDTTTWKLLDWRGRTVLSLLFRKVDRAGVLDVGHDGVLGLAAVLELPLEIAEAGIAQLTTCRGGTPTVLDAGTAYVLPNFIEAQEAAQSDPQRKRESRARRRDRAVAVSRNLLLPPAAAGSDTDGHEIDRRQDANAEQVTPIRSDPIRSDPDLPLSHAIPPSPVPTPVAPAPTTTTYDPSEPRDRGELAETTYQRVSLARIQVAAELKLPAPLPFPAITPSSRPRAFSELLDRVREEGAAAPAVCDLVVANLVAQARETKSIDWLSLKSFSSGAWTHAREWVSAKPTKLARAGPKAAPPAAIPREQLAGPEQFAEARALLAAVTSNDDDTPREKRPTPTRKAT